MSNDKNENSGDEKNAARNSGGATPMSVSLHTYQVTKVPAGCTDWVLNETFDVYVSDPADPKIVINNGDACDGTEATLVS